MRFFPIARMVALASAMTAISTVPLWAQMGMGRGGPMPGGMMGHSDCPMMGMMPAGQEARINDRLDTLKRQLTITPAQEATWSAYTAAVKKGAEGMQGVHQTMRQAMSAKSPIDRLDGHVTAIDGRSNLLKGLKPALATLYAGLSAEQKAKADTQLAGRGCML